MLFRRLANHDTQIFHVVEKIQPKPHHKGLEVQAFQQNFLLRNVHPCGESQRAQGVYNVL